MDALQNPHETVTWGERKGISITSLGFSVVQNLRFC